MLRWTRTCAPERSSLCGGKKNVLNLTILESIKSNQVGGWARSSIDFCLAFNFTLFWPHCSFRQRKCLMFLWLSGRALCQQRKGCGFNSQGTHTDNKWITWMHCKLLWIKASAKCINVNVMHGWERISGYYIGEVSQKRWMEVCPKSLPPNSPSHSGP